VHDGVIYGFDNATLRAISVDDGETIWAKRGFGKGSLIYADGHLVVLSDKGVLALVETGSGAYAEKGRVQALEGRCWTAPTLADGKLYLRNHDEIVSYDLKR
jgi:outer membrane protein assembly factor BamB